MFYSFTLQLEFENHFSLILPRASDDFGLLHCPCSLSYKFVGQKKTLFFLESLFPVYCGKREMMGKARQNICSLCCFLKQCCSKFAGTVRNPVLSPYHLLNNCLRPLCRSFLCCSPSAGNSLKPLKAVSAG